MPSFKRKRIPENPTSLRSMRRRLGGRSRTVKTLSYKVNKLLSEQERKNLDIRANLTMVGGTAQIVQLNSIPQGDDAVSRDGRKVSMVSSQARYVYAAETATIPPKFRVIFFVDKQSNGLTPAAADVLTVATSYLSPLTLDFKERFRVIHDNFCGVEKAGGVLDLGSSLPGSYWRKIQDDIAQVEFGGIGNIPTSGSLLMLILTAQNGNFEYYHRLRFTDS